MARAPLELLHEGHPGCRLPVITSTLALSRLPVAIRAAARASAVAVSRLAFDLQVKVPDDLGRGVADAGDADSPQASGCRRRS